MSGSVETLVCEAMAAHLEAQRCSGWHLRWLLYKAGFAVSRYTHLSVAGTLLVSPGSAWAPGLGLLHGRQNELNLVVHPISLS